MPVGAPKGNRNAAKGARFRDALNRCLEARGGMSELVEIAGVLVDNAKAGEAWAMKELIDRLDGKPKQSIEADITDSIGLVDLLRNAGSTKGT